MVIVSDRPAAPAVEETPRPPDRSSTRATYDRIGGWYDLTEGPFHAGLRRAALRLASAGPGERILEIGPGTGHELLDFVHRAGSGRVWGIDLSRGMLDSARRRVEGAGVVLLQGDGTRLPLSSGTFDLVFSCFVLDLLPRPAIARVLGEARRVLRPGGRAVLLSLASGRPSPGLRWYRLVRRRMPRLVACRPIPLRRCVEEAGLLVRRVRRAPLMGLPAETVKAVRP